MSAQYGIFSNVFQQEILQEWHDIYKKLPTKTHTIYGDPCWGIDMNSLAYAWFKKVVLKQIQKHLGDDLKLIFSSFIDLSHILLIHNDIKRLPENANGQHAYSVLIPYSVNHNDSSFDKVGTCFYDDNKKLIENITWQKGSMIWWKSELLHNSSNFKDLGIDSKQYFITHTYV